MSRTAWFDGPLPRILAHRGLALDAPQNSIDAFLAALAAGATHIETDTHVTVDGHAVLVHDPQAADGEPPVASLTLRELQRRAPWVPTAAEAFAALPAARWNIDVKAAAAAGAVARAIRESGATERVLLTSFSGSRRRDAIAGLPGVATSASVDGVLASLAAFAAGRTPRLPGVDAVQIPERTLRFDLTRPDRIAAWHRAGVEVHFWVIDDPERMRVLVERGADGIVTDRTDLAAAALR